MSKANMLVVDDQESIRHFVSKALGDEGYTVHTTGSLGETRQVLEHDVPDLCIFDLKLPDGSGIDLLREVKRVHPEMPIILMTAFGEIETAVEAMSAGAYWFVKKIEGSVCPQCKAYEKVYGRKAHEPIPGQESN